MSLSIRISLVVFVAIVNALMLLPSLIGRDFKKAVLHNQSKTRPHLNDGVEKWNQIPIHIPYQTENRSCSALLSSLIVSTGIARDTGIHKRNRISSGESILHNPKTENVVIYRFLERINLK
jgi:hypothetical protein